MISKLEIIIVFFLIILSSCKKVDKIETKLHGSWERVVFDHRGKETWTFTEDNKIYLVLTIESLGIIGDTVSIGDYTMEIVRYSHGTLLNKNIFKVPEITITGFENYKYNSGQSNLYFPAYNTKWQIHQLDKESLIITTNLYDNKQGGLEIREFFKN